MEDPNDFKESIDGAGDIARTPNPSFTRGH